MAMKALFLNCILKKSPDMKINQERRQYSLNGQAAGITITGNADMHAVSVQLVSSSNIIGQQDDSTHFGTYFASHKVSQRIFHPASLKELDEEAKKISVRNC